MAIGGHYGRGSYEGFDAKAAISTSSSHHYKRPLRLVSVSLYRSHMPAGIFASTFYSSSNPLPVSITSKGSILTYHLPPNRMLGVSEVYLVPLGRPWVAHMPTGISVQNSKEIGGTVGRVTSLSQEVTVTEELLGPESFDKVFGVQSLRSSKGFDFNSNCQGFVFLVVLPNVAVAVLRHVGCAWLCPSMVVGPLEWVWKGLRGREPVTRYVVL